MSKVAPGMLAVVVRYLNEEDDVSEIYGRIVFVERFYAPHDVFRDVNGERFWAYYSDNPGTLMVVSAKEPLPVMHKTERKIYTHERPLLAENLRPLLDPDLGVTEDEVRELYAPKETVSV